MQQILDVEPLKIEYIFRKIKTTNAIELLMDARSPTNTSETYTISYTEPRSSGDHNF